MRHDLRAVLDAIGYLTRYGVEWRALPVDFPPWEAVNAFFQRWSEQDLPRQLADRLRGRIRVTCDRTESPTAAVIDAQTVRGAATVTAAGMQDRDTAHRLLALLRERFSTITMVRADGGYAGRLVVWAATVLHLTITIMTRRLTRELAGDPPPPRWGQPRQANPTTA
jgi:transposase